MAVALNGWTSARLDDLAKRVDDGFAEVKGEIAEMRSEEIAELKQDLVAAKRAPRDKLTAYLIPLLVALVPTIAVLLHHAS